MQEQSAYKYKFSVLLLFSLLTLGNSFNVLAEEKPYLNIRVLSAKLAQQAASSAYEDCRLKGYKVSVAVLDRRGGLMAFIRNPLAGAHTIEISQRKAYSSATYQTPTSEMRDMEEFRFTPGVSLLGGGLPIRVAGHFYGAIGVGGAPADKKSGDIDERCAQTGIDAIAEALEFSD